MLQGEHSAILSIFIKLSFVIKICVLSIFEWPLKTGFTVDLYSLFDFVHMINTQWLFVMEILVLDAALQKITVPVLNRKLHILSLVGMS